jgi:hypothetical protein
MSLVERIIYLGAKLHTVEEVLYYAPGTILETGLTG